MSKVNGVKSVLDKLKYITIRKGRDIHIIPESGKYDGTLVWLHGLAE